MACSAMQLMKGNGLQFVFRQLGFSSTHERQYVIVQQAAEMGRGSCEASGDTKQRHLGPSELLRERNYFGHDELSQWQSITNVSEGFLDLK